MKHDYKSSFWYCEKLERDRERSKRNAQKREHLLDVLYLDFEAAENWENSPSWLSDKGQGVERIIRACDGEIGENFYLRQLESARRKVKRHLPKSLAVFDLVVENGSNRKESICRLALKKARNGTPPRSNIGDTSKNC